MPAVNYDKERSIQRIKDQYALITLQKAKGTIMKSTSAKHMH